MNPREPTILDWSDFFARYIYILKPGKTGQNDS